MSNLPPQIQQELVEFEKICQANLLEDNEIRRKAEQAFSKFKAENPDKFMSFLTLLLQHSKADHVRLFCAVMLRQNALLKAKIEDDMWAKLQPNTQNTIKNILLELLKTEQKRTIRTKVCEVIGPLASQSLDEDGNTNWPELLKTVIELSKSNDPAIREATLGLLDQIGEHAINLLQPHLRPLKQILINGLQDGSKDSSIRIAALKATISILVSLQESEANTMSDLVPLMFHTLGTVLKEQDDSVTLSAIVLLTTLVRTRPKVLRMHLSMVVAGMKSIAEHDALEMDTKKAALNFLVTLAEEGKGAIRKLNDYPQLVIPLVMKWLCIFEHTNDWETYKDPDDADQEEYSTAVAAVQSLSQNLGGKAFIKVAHPIIMQLRQSQNWKERHAALTCVQRMVDACEEFIVEQNMLKGYIDMCLFHSEKDPHLRCRWTAVNALAQISVSFSPTIQKEYHQVFLPHYIKMAEANVHPRLTDIALLSTIDFITNECETEVLAKYSDQLLMTLSKLMQTNNLRIQEAVLSCAAAVANTIDEGFAKYFDAFFSGACQVLFTATAEEQKELRGKACEAVGFMALAVGKEKMMTPTPQGPLFKAPTECMVNLLSQNLSVSDPLYAYLHAAIARMAKCVIEEFVPYLPKVLPYVLKSAANDEVGAITSEGEVNPFEGKEGYDTEVVNMRVMGTKRISINTSYLEDKKNAVLILYEYADALGIHFAPYVEASIKVLKECLTCQFNEDIRNVSVQAIPALLKIAKEATSKQPNAPPLTSPQHPVRAMFDFVFPSLLKALSQEVHLDSLTGSLDALHDTLWALDSPMKPEQIKECCQLLQVLITEAVERMKDRVKKMQDEDCDEQEREILTQENDEEDTMLGYIFTVIMRMSHMNGTALIPSFDEELYDLLWPLVKDAPEQVKTFAICCISQAVEDAPQHEICVNKYIFPLFNACLPLCGHEDVDLRQSACFAVGVAAIVLKEKFAPAVRPSLEALFAVIQKTDSRNEDNARATDNAISAIGKIIKYVGHVLKPEGIEDVRQLLPQWLSMLPCSGDEEEAQKIHQMLADFIEGPASLRDSLFGPNQQNLPKIIALLAKLIYISARSQELEEAKADDSEKEQAEAEAAMAIVDIKTYEQFIRIIKGIAAKIGPQQTLSAVDVPRYRNYLALLLR